MKDDYEKYPLKDPAELGRLRRANAYQLAILEIACKYGDEVHGTVHLAEDPPRLMIWFPVTDVKDVEALNKLGYHQVLGRAWYGPPRSEIRTYIDAYMTENPFPAEPPPPTPLDIYRRELREKLEEGEGGKVSERNARLRRVLGLK